jgi:hypothetical protein
MKHTFASSSRPSASHKLSLVILGGWLPNKEPARNVCNVEHFLC